MQLSVTYNDFLSADHMEESIADKITSSCGKIKNAVLRIRDYHSCFHNDSISGDFSWIYGFCMMGFIYG